MQFIYARKRISLSVLFLSFQGSRPFLGRISFRRRSSFTYSIPWLLRPVDEATPSLCSHVTVFSLLFVLYLSLSSLSAESHPLPLPPFLSRLFYVLYISVLRFGFTALLHFRIYVLLVELWAGLITPTYRFYWYCENALSRILLLFSAFLRRSLRFRAVRFRTSVFIFIANTNSQ